MLGMWQARTPKEKFLCFQEQAKAGKGWSSFYKPPNQGDHAILIKNSSLNFSSMNTNFNVMQDDTLSWWIYSGASRHVCNSTKWFKTLHKVVDGEHLFMGNNAPIMVQGKAQIDLLFTSGNLLVLRDVYYAPEISRNLVSGPVLYRLSYKLVFEADRCIISKNNLFVGHTYLCNSLFKLSLDLNKDVIRNVSHELSNEKVVCIICGMLDWTC